MDASFLMLSRKICCMLALVIPTTFVDLAAGDDKTAAGKDAADKPNNSKPALKKVILKGLTLNLPSAWAQQESRSTMRLGQFEIAPVDGDHEPSELVVFQFGPRGGGDAQANITRWVGQFETAGRKVSTLEGTFKGGKYQLADITGNYKKAIGPPIQGQFELKKGWRVLNVRLDGDEGVFFLKLAGPQKTIDAAAEAFRKSFGGDATREKELPLEKSPKE